MLARSREQDAVQLREDLKKLAAKARDTRAKAERRKVRVTSRVCSHCSYCKCSVTTLKESVVHSFKPGNYKDTRYSCMIACLFMLFCMRAHTGLVVLLQSDRVLDVLDLNRFFM